MSDPMKECVSACCALCCLCGAASFQSWATTARCGVCQGNGNAGCCDSCCKRSFDSDDFDEQVKRDMAETSAANATIVVQQPTPVNNEKKMAVNKE